MRVEAGGDRLLPSTGRTSFDPGADLGELVRTKLVAPAAARHRVHRQGLIARLRQRGLRKLTLVLAPAGFGKTTFLTQIRDELLEQGVSPCWISLGQHDAAPTELLAYMLEALATIDPALGASARQMLRGAGAASLGGVIERLLNELVLLDRPVALILDDYHVVDSPEIAPLMMRLLDPAVHRLHIVIAGRSEPALPLAQLQAHGGMLRFDAADLRFSASETAGFLGEALGRTLTAERLSFLQDRTEGWPAGLQLAEIALHGAENWDEFAEGFGGDARDVVDYLASDVFQSLSGRERDFLMQTSVLERVNADVARVLTGMADSQALLEDLHRRNLFIVALDRNRTWYRYHNLFQDFLLGRLHDLRVGAAEGLERRACQWFAENGYVAEAIGYALKTRDHGRAIALLGLFGDQLLRDGQMMRLYEWTLKIPPEVARDHARVHLLRCWSLFHMRRSHEAGIALARAEEILDAGDATERAAAQPEIGVLKAGVAVARDDIDLVLRLTPADFDAYAVRWQEATMANIVGFACVCRSRFAEGEALLLRAREAHRANQSAFGQVYANCFLGISASMRGALDRAEALLADAQALAESALGEATPGTAAAKVVRASLAVERNDLDAAEMLLAGRAHLLDDCVHVEVDTIATLAQVRLAAARGDDAQAERLMEAVIGDDAFLDLPRQRILVVAEWVSIQVRIDPHRARLLAHAEQIVPTALLPDDAEGTWDRATFLRAYLGLLLAASAQPSRAVFDATTALIDRAARFGRPRWTILCWMIRAHAARRLDRPQDFVGAMTAACDLARAHGYIRTLIDFPLGSLDLLRTFAAVPGAAAIHAAQAHARLLIRSAARTDARRAPAADGRPSSVSIATGARAVPCEPLSDREIDVLHLIARGEGNRAIAGRLAIAENTVKWHLKNIFGKLEVTNRTAAARRLAELGLDRPPDRVG